MYKFENCKLPSVISSMFYRNCDVHQVDTRQSHHLHIPAIRHEYSKRSFKYQAIKIYNAYCDMFNFSLSAFVFKKNIKSHFLINDIKP